MVVNSLLFDLVIQHEGRFQLQSIYELILNLKSVTFVLQSELNDLFTF